MEAPTPQFAMVAQNCALLLTGTTPRFFLPQLRNGRPASYRSRYFLAHWAWSLLTLPQAALRTRPTWGACLRPPKPPFRAVTALKTLYNGKRLVSVIPARFLPPQRPRGCAGLPPAGPSRWCWRAKIRPPSPRRAPRHETLPSRRDVAG